MAVGIFKDFELSEFALLENISEFRILAIGIFDNWKI